MSGMAMDERVRNIARAAEICRESPEHASPESDLMESIQAVSAQLDLEQAESNMEKPPVAHPGRFRAKFRCSQIVDIRTIDDSLTGNSDAKTAAEERSAQMRREYGRFSMNASAENHVDNGLWEEAQMRRDDTEKTYQQIKELGASHNTCYTGTMAQRTMSEDHKAAIAAGRIEAAAVRDYLEGA